ncbi:uncharacterized protein BDW47DRAFT_108796 [Aspergillus candidus]|uniref:Uncharacterized protein n=1 Tax=Aspergillus candidus TaxID=41067 RepID=A0A2I2F6X9_ASPCN|nr:hypothetical protein BDW47DRAFT_108796 [Aspergillus candidus]PLB36328.1 hypothetical protein BDW47DRAFT_108796 [Aspergillus candidus]
MTGRTLVMSNRRGSARKQLPLRLPIIAPKDDIHASSSALSIPALIKASIPRSRLRFPPRSRSGCWTCRVSQPFIPEGDPRIFPRYANMCACEARVGKSNATKPTLNAINVHG